MQLPFFQPVPAEARNGVTQYFVFLKKYESVISKSCGKTRLDLEKASCSNEREFPSSSMDAKAVCDFSDAASSSTTCDLLEATSVNAVVEESFHSAFISDQYLMNLIDFPITAFPSSKEPRY